MQRILTPDLEIRDLQVALALASAGTTAKAAALLHITQPAVSRALLSLEEKLETRLFERGPRGLEPTQAGARLLAGAQELLASLCDLEHRVRSDDAPTRVRMVCECYTAYHWLPSALHALRRTLPGLSLSVSVEHTGDPLSALSAGKLDAALVTTSEVPRSSPLMEAPLFTDEIVFVMAHDHPLAKKRALTPRDIQQAVLLSSHTPPAEQHWFLTRVFGRARPRLKFERLPLTEAIFDMARAGMGVAVLSEWIAAPQLARGDLVAKRLSSGSIERPWRLVFRPEVEQAAARLIPALRSTVPQARLTG
ncbi:MAG: LysR family transcriptional regulator [Myxococcales bacterium]